jgi:hypothetical protein
MLSAAVMMMAWLGLFANRTRFILTIAGIVGLATAIWPFLPQYDGEAATAFNKLSRSFEEISFTDSYNSVEMVRNWRGHEAYNAQYMFNNSSSYHKIFGNGLGSSVDLGQDISFNIDGSFRTLPILHNGYYHIIIKYGLIGALIYIAFVLSWCRGQRAYFDRYRFNDRMIVGATIVILLSTTVITGLFNKYAFDNFVIVGSLLLGLSLRERIRGYH